MIRATSKEFKPSITKSDLVKILSRNQNYLATRDVDLAVKSLLNMMSNSLSSGERIEIRGFGSFNLHYNQPRKGRNPRTGDPVDVPGKFVPNFRPAKELRERVL